MKQLVPKMADKRGLRFSKATCPICGCKEVAHDSRKGELLCTNCGHIIVRKETRSVGKFEIAQRLKRNGSMDFSSLVKATNASEDSLFGALQSMEDRGIIRNSGNQYMLTKKGRRWYRQRLGQEWGY